MKAVMGRFNALKSLCSSSVFDDWRECLALARFSVVFRLGPVTWISFNVFEDVKITDKTVIF